MLVELFKESAYVSAGRLCGEYVTGKLAGGVVGCGILLLSRIRRYSLRQGQEGGGHGVLRRLARRQKFMRPRN